MLLKYTIPQQFQMFYPIMKEYFINNYDKLLTYVQSKSNEISTQHVGIYSMTTNINYSNLENKLIKTKTFIESEK